jgi:hypothetical protein
VILLKMKELQKMFNTQLTSNFVRRTMAFTAILGASVAVMGAQTATGSTTGAETGNFPAVSTSAAPLFSSSSADDSTPAVTNEAAVTKPFNFVDAMQYGGRQSYGRPRYRGGNTNSDGSAKWIFFGGGGFGVPVGQTSNDLTTGWGLQVGGGRQFNKHFAVPIQFDYDHFGFTNTVLNNQLTIYNSPNVNADFSNLGGSSHVWSFTVDPTMNFYQGDSLGAYAVVGVGFYHKTANFTIPATGEYYDPYYGLIQYEANETIDKYTSNAPGFSGGLGITYKFSKFSNQKLYGEVRYVYMDNSYKPGITANTTGSITATTTNFYPDNSLTTYYIPVKFGIRF